MFQNAVILNEPACWNGNKTWQKDGRIAKNDKAYNIINPFVFASVCVMIVLRDMPQCEDQKGPNNCTCST